MSARWPCLVLFACASSLAQAERCPIPGDELPACADPAGCVVDIRSNTGSPDPRLVLMKAVGRDNTTVRLGPEVDLDFSSLPSCLFPINFGRKVTLTSVASFQSRPLPANVNTNLREEVGAASADGGNASAERNLADAARRAGELAEGLRDLEVERVRDVGPARTPRTLGPALRYGRHRSDSDDVVFFENRCFEGVLNEGTRISGFRLFGPSFGQQETGEVGIAITRCADVEIFNMEIAGWGGAGIKINDDRDRSGFGDRILGPQQVRIHDNYLHNNQQPTDCSIAGNVGSAVGVTDCHAGGYGVDVGHGAWAQISGNVFDANRHSIAAAGDVGGYLAENNLILKGGGYHGGHAWHAAGRTDCPRWRLCRQPRAWQGGARCAGPGHEHRDGGPHRRLRGRVFPTGHRWLSRAP